MLQYSSVTKACCRISTGSIKARNLNRRKSSKSDQLMMLTTWFLMLVFLYHARKILMMQYLRSITGKLFRFMSKTGYVGTDAPTLPLDNRNRPVA
jgi:hypothetical protein